MSISWKARKPQEETELVMVIDDEKSPFRTCRDRILSILEEFFEDFDGLVCAPDSNSYQKKGLIFGIISRRESVVPIGVELWRYIRLREWDKSNRQRPLRGDELELVLYSLAERGSYSNRGMNTGWRLFEREDQTTSRGSGTDAVYRNDTRRSRGKREVLS